MKEDEVLSKMTGRLADERRRIASILGGMPDVVIMDDVRTHTGAPRTGRRLRRFAVSPRAILSLFTQPAPATPDFVVTYRLSGVPPDAILENVAFDVNLHSFTFMIRHQSFDVVPDGEYPPLALAAVEIIQVARASAEARRESAEMARRILGTVVTSPQIRTSDVGETPEETWRGRDPLL